MRPSDGQVAERIKPITSVVKPYTNKASTLLNGFSFDLHPRRTKLIFGAKVAGATTLILAMIFSRKRVID